MVGFIPFIIYSIINPILITARIAMGIIYMLNWEHKSLPNSNYQPITDTEKLMIAKFPFLDRFQLVAVLERGSGSQEMRIEFLAEDGSVLDGSKTSCTHTAIATTTLEEIQNIPSDTTKEEYFYGVRSTEGIAKKGQIELHLSSEEHFFALKSWVQGIAEAGTNIFKNLQILREFSADLNIYPIIHKILCFIFRYSRDYFEFYLRWVEKECQIDGRPHIPSLIASLEPLIEFTQYLNIDRECSKTIGQAFYPEIDNILLSMDFPLDVYAAILSYPTMKEKFSTHPDYERIIFKYPNRDLARDTKAVKYDLYKSLFECKDPDIIHAVINNPCATVFPEYKNYFLSSDPYIREELASSQISSYQPEFLKLFKDPDSNVRYKLANNRFATKFEEYQLLYKDKDKHVREAVNNTLRRIRESQKADDFFRK
jgi:hypothetical protein